MELESSAGKCQNAPSLSPPTRRLVVVCFSLAFCISLTDAIFTQFWGSCSLCNGFLTEVLPWLGVFVYGFLIALAYSRHDSVLIPLMVAALFFHALLSADAIITDHICPTCLTIALLACAAAILIAKDISCVRATLALAFLFGSLLSPFGAVDAFEMTFSPKEAVSRALVDLPQALHPSNVGQCEHRAAVKLIVYETHGCRVCTTAKLRIIPKAKRQFGEIICIHYHQIERIPKGHRTPIFVFLGSTGRCGILEGLPGYEEFAVFLQRFLLLETSDGDKHR